MHITRTLLGDILNGERELPEVPVHVTRFRIGEVPTLGGWQVTDTYNGVVTRFGTDRIGALDFMDHQNWAAGRAAQFAAPQD